MISQSERSELLEKVNGDTDYKMAAIIYERKTGKKIFYRYFYKFLSGERKITGKKPGSHQPLTMYASVVEAIAARENESEKMTGKAREMRERLAA